ncbi:hypothetical protein IFM89_029116 [Coptis chinensis]|uniref:Benzyl alcohol O-benzoyltransferase n=1 Tax=Coptis chinensis TaxID=261450 RepID=A0A835GYF5_9MAGN|nr:hypothetical protein IFM89_029116 [Coptis chinensis]
MTTPYSSLIFTVKRSEPELVFPALPTPHEFKSLSDIDDQRGHRFQVQNILFYRNSFGMEGRDPVKVIKEAIAKTLVYYYPFAGRLREGPNDKLIVECTGEGSGGILHCPLLLIQVTRLMCGGFIFGIRINHTIVDASGLVQFVTAVAEITRGKRVPSVLPVWERHLLNARDPPHVSCVHHFYRELHKDINNGMTLDDMNYIVHRNFFFGTQEIANLRSQLPPQLRACSKFDMLAASLWRCYTSTLNLKSDDEVCFTFPVDTRGKFTQPLPIGFYGNSIVHPAAMSTASKLCANPLGYAVALVKRAKADVTEEFRRSTADLLVKKGRPRATIFRTCILSDLTCIGFQDIDFGWGKALYGGPTKATVTAIFLLPSRNIKGEDGIVLAIELPKSSMERFVIEIQKLLREPPNNDNNSSSFIASPL